MKQNAFNFYSVVDEINAVKFNKFLFFLLTVLSLSACAVRTGLLVEFSGGDKPLMGEAVATIMSGTFHVSNLDGYTCNGTYNQWTESPMLKVDVTCSDGRYGKVMVLRTGPNLVNGSGEGTLNDGTTFNVLMGDMIHYRDAQGIWEKTK